MADPATAAPGEVLSPDPAEAKRQADCARRWIAELTTSEKAQRKWLERSKKIAKRFRRDDSDTVKDRRYAMLWSNTQTIQPAIYTRPPTPLVSRRFSDADPVARVAGEALERSLVISIDVQDLDAVLRQGSFDFVLYARGQAWERYEPSFGPEVTPEIALQITTDGEDEGYVDDDGNSYDDDQVQTREDGSAYAMGEPYKPVIYEESITDYINWEDFGHSVSRTWNEVGFVWRRAYLGRDELVKRFGAVGKVVPLDWGPVAQGPRDEAARMQNKAAIYEIWDKASKKAYWISKSWSSRPLDERDDPLGLPDFFPCPRPLLGTTANDNVIPVPEYVFYQDQAEEIDALTARIASLQDALKVRGFYAADGKTNLNNLLNSANNILIPVPDWVSLKEDGGLKGRIEWFPIDQVVGALNALIAQRQQLINDVYQITGIADILRGQGDPSSTAMAEGIKAQWGTLRIRDRQIEMMRFARDVLRIKGAVIAAKFSADTLKAMTGMKLPMNAEKQQAMAQFEQAQQQAQLQAAQAHMVWQGQASQAQQTGQQPPPPPPRPQPQPMPDDLQQLLQAPSWEDVETLLKDNSARVFRIDIETDSTIEPNEAQEKQAVTEFMTAMSGFIAQWGPAVAAQPELAPMAGAMIKFGARRFRAGRELEEVIDTTVDKITAKAAQAPPPGAAGPAQPAPADLAKVQVETIKQETAAQSNQAETQRTQIMAAVKEAEVQVKAEANHLKLVEMSQPPPQNYPQGLA